MITLTNKQTSYSIANESNTIKLTGNVSINEDGKILSLRGNFYLLDDSYAGNFYYEENASNKVNRSMSDVDVARHFDADNFLDATITELKTMINEL